MTSATTDQTGELFKLQAHALLEAKRELYILRGRRALLIRLLDHGRAVADDVRAAVEIPPGVDPVLCGCIPGLLARSRIIQKDGFQPTNRAAGHARPVTIWTLVDRDAALRWLNLHPEPAPADTPAEGLHE